MGINFKNVNNVWCENRHFSWYKTVIKLCQNVDDEWNEAIGIRHEKEEAQKPTQKTKRGKEKKLLVLNVYQERKGFI